MKLLVKIGLAALAAATLAGGCHHDDTSASSAVIPHITQLPALPVAADGSMAGYSRAKFGEGWATQPDGCSTRVDVLIKQGTDVDTHGCVVTSGQWLSLYDGVTVTDPHSLDIDHLVPLAEAWRTGAAGWSAARREAFANDMSVELVAVTAHSNRSKGDDAPPVYEPPVYAEDCPYARQWIAVKLKYGLTVTLTEQTALATMLATCKKGS